MAHCILLSENYFTKQPRIDFFMKFALFAAIPLLAALACAPRVVVPPSIPDTDTEVASDECEMMKEVCRQAQEFQKQYETLPEEEKKDMSTILSTYVEHCRQATESCKKSAK
jgi:hypothetical protein